MFEKASRLKLRFAYKGLVSAEDLWDLPVRALDSVYKQLVKEEKAQEEESLLDKRSNANTVLNLQVSIIKHVVATKLDEQEKRKDTKEKAERKQKVLEIISSKQDQVLLDMPLEELQKMVE